jgi:hypothetical protein
VFWGIDIPEGETPPISTGTDPEIEEEA